jgi:GxxExxY protein
MSHGFPRIFTDNPVVGDVHSLSMDMAPVELKHHELTERIIGVFYDVYNELGYGFLESTHASAMMIALSQSGLVAAREVPVSVWFRRQEIGQYFADILVNGQVLLELKAARALDRALDRAHEAQLLHYLRATEIEVGLLLNFGQRPQFRRLLFDNDRKRIRENPRESVAKGSA